MKSKKGKLNLMSTDQGGDVNSEMNDVEDYSESRDVEYLFSLRQQKDSLMTYECEINSCQGTALIDMGATRNFVSKEFAEKSNLKFLNKMSPRDVKLPSGETMRILGNCEFDMQMSE